MIWLPLPSLCKRGTVLGTESGLHRLVIVQAARRRLLPRGKTKTCSQANTCCINLYRNAMSRVSAEAFLFALRETVVSVMQVYSPVILGMVKWIDKNCALLRHYAASSGKKNYQYFLRNDSDERSSQLLRDGNLKSRR